MLKFQISGKFLMVSFILLIHSSAPVFAQVTTSAESVIVRRAEAGNKTEDDETGSIIRGRVTYQDSGSPVRRGWITLRKIKELVEPPKDQNAIIKRSYSTGNERYVLTDDQGEFTMSAVKSGIYQVVTRVPGILNPDLGDFDDPHFQQISVDGVSKMQIAVSILRGAAISGKIFYADGAPVIGAKVQVFRYQGKIVTSSNFRASDDVTVTVTDDRGAYRLSGLPAGEYFLRVVEPSLQANYDKGVEIYNLAQSQTNSELKTYYPNTESSKDAALIQASLGQEQTDVNITIPDRRLFSAFGLVIEKNSKTPLAGVTLRFSKINDGKILEYGEQSRQIKTDAQGFWKLIDLPKGKYRINAAQDTEYEYDNNGKRTPKNVITSYAPAFREVEIDEKNLENINIEMPVAATISGFVTAEGDKPVPDNLFLSVISETFKYSANGRLAEAKNDDKNKTRRAFVIEKVPNGKFYMTGSTYMDYYIKSIRYGNRDLLNELIEIEGGEKIENIQIVLSSETGMVKGKVRNVERGERVFVILLPTDRNGVSAFGSSRQVPVSESGDFSVKAPPGEYSAFVGTSSNRPNFEKFAEWIANVRAKSQKITVRLNETSSIVLSANE